MTKLTESDTQGIIKYLNDKWHGRPCPLCQSAKWIVQDGFFQLTAYHPGKMVLGGAVIPLIPVTCSNCSNTILVNAILSGVLKQQADEIKVEAKSEEIVNKMDKSL